MSSASSSGSSAPSLAAAALMWSGNWIAGRALRDAYDPVELNFFRWAIAVAVLAPFALPELRGKAPVIRRNLKLLALLAFTGVALFQSMVYLGLRTTTAVNAVLINSSLPLFILLCSWTIEGERATARQVAGMLTSLAGIDQPLLRTGCRPVRSAERDGPPRCRLRARALLPHVHVHRRGQRLSGRRIHQYRYSNGQRSDESQPTGQRRRFWHAGQMITNRPYSST